jgi:hypothetical protein
VPGFQYRRVRFFVMRGPQSVNVRFEPLGADVSQAR